MSVNLINLIECIYVSHGTSAIWEIRTLPGNVVLRTPPCKVSIAVIVAAFMLGLGLGSHLGAVLSTRLSLARALALFAACELTIAAFGALSCTLYYDWLYVRW